MHSQQIHALPPQLRLLVLSYCPNISRGSGMTVRHAFQRSQHTAPSNLQSFKNNRSPARLWSHLAWLIPMTGGVALYLSPGQQIHIASIFSSPTLIPCTKHDLPLLTRDPIIGSPAEPQMSITSRILSLLQEHIWEPLLTARRFTHLFFLFVPVIITMPMLLVGKPERRYKGDRWGAVWWYEFLVRRMQSAGPTFIKVFHTAIYHSIFSLFSLHNGRHCVLISSLHYFARKWAPYTHAASLIH
jgi:aarF domain-containing kinase